MDDPPRRTDTATDHGSPPRMPRWVKLSVITVVVLVVLAAAIALFGGDHGPDRHVGAGDARSATVTATQVSPSGPSGRSLS